MIRMVRPDRRIALEPRRTTWSGVNRWRRFGFRFPTVDTGVAEAPDVRAVVDVHPRRDRLRVLRIFLPETRWQEDVERACQWCS